jgi:hypothetical protein
LVIATLYRTVLRGGTTDTGVARAAPSAAGSRPSGARTSPAVDRPARRPAGYSARGRPTQDALVDRAIEARTRAIQPLLKPN